MHIVLASILAPLVCQAFVPAVAGPVEFGLGLFPIEDTIDFARSLARKRLEISAAPGTSSRPSSNLIQGMNKDVLDRLKEEGISSTIELAYYDPIKLFLKTNFPWPWVIDVMDQAILVNYVEAGIEKLRCAGIRGGIEACVAGEPDLSPLVQGVVTILAIRLGITDVEARNLGTNLYEDGQLDLIWRLYRPYEG